MRVTAVDNGSPSRSSTATFTITVESVTVSVSDASGDEGSAVTFDVRLSATLPAAVTMAFSTSTQADDTAEANADFTPVTNMRVTFEPGEVLPALPVAMPEDSQSEAAETFTVTLSAAPGAPLPTGVTLGRTTATGTIRANAGNMADRVGEDVLPRVAQAMASSTLSAITGRIESVVSGSLPSPATNLAGTSTLLQALKSSEGELERARWTWRRRWTARPLWCRSPRRRTSTPTAPARWPCGAAPITEAFRIRATAWSIGPATCSMPSSGRIYSCGPTCWPGWRFRGLPARTTLPIAAPAPAPGQGRGRYETRMTSVHPYVSWSPTGALGLCATLGYGLGGIEINEAGAAGRQSDTTMQMAAIGASHRLLSADDGVIAGGGATLRLKGEDPMARIKVDGESRIPAASYDVQRLRLSLEGRYERPAPSVEAGGRDPVTPLLHHSGGLHCRRAPLYQPGFGPDAGGPRAGVSGRPGQP